MKKLLLFLVCLILLISNVSGVLTVSSNNISDTSISWNWNSGYNITKLSIDGYNVILYDNQTNSFDLTGLNPNEKHTIKIYSISDSGENTASTRNTKTVNTLADFVFAYIWWMIAACLLVAAVAYKSSMIGIISAISCLIGMVKGIQDQSFIVFFLYVVTFICAYVITENIREG